MIIGALLVLAGVVGCFLPIIPGPPLSYVGILLLHFTSRCDFTLFTLISMGIAMVVVTVLDFIVPAWGTKKMGGSKWGVRGCSLGLIVGLFVPPWGIFFCPFIGAFVGELLYAKKHPDVESEHSPFVMALGSFVGLLFGIFLKLAYSCFALFLFVKELIMAFF